VKPLLIALIILMPSSIDQYRAGIPCTMGERVGTRLYVQYWQARLYHGDYIVWEDKGTLWFERNGHVIEFKRKGGVRR